MISLALKSKVRISEDILTAALFDAIRHHSAWDILKTILRTAAGTSLCISTDFDSAEIELWPQNPAGEPDSRILLYRDGKLTQRILIEAKLGAPKSGHGELTEVPSEGDQIARYLIQEEKLSVGCPVGIIYLTHHAGMPRDELAESLETLRKNGRADLCSRVWWLGWRDVETHLRNNKLPLSFHEVAELLGRVAMFRFSGMRFDRLTAFTVHPIFYRANRAESAIGTRYRDPGVRLGEFYSSRWAYGCTTYFRTVNKLELSGSSGFYSRRTL